MIIGNRGSVLVIFEYAMMVLSLRGKSSSRDIPSRDFYIALFKILDKMKNSPIFSKTNLRSSAGVLEGFSNLKVTKGVERKIVGKEDTPISRVKGCEASIS